MQALQSSQASTPMNVTSENTETKTQRTMFLVPYNHEWKKQATEEVSKLGTIANKCNKLFIALHHIGSTSVPGLSAKPVIDIIGIVENVIQLEDEITKNPNLLTVNGYKYIGKIDEDSDHRCAVKVNEDTANALLLENLVHLHIYGKDSKVIGERLAFRDYLIAHPLVAKEYEQIKQGNTGKDQASYFEGKGDFVKNAIKDALVWQNKNVRPE